MRQGIELLEARTKRFAVDVIKLSITLEKLPGLRQLSWQLSCSAGSVGANHRAMRRARSNREFAAKLQIVNEEIDETVFWLEVAREVHPNTAIEDLEQVTSETRQLRSIFAAARATTRERLSERSP